MKKILMGITACVLILSSCNKNEVFENIDQNNSQLTFSLVAGTQTRAAELTATALQAAEIDIWARYSTDKQVYFKDLLEYGTKWNTKEFVRFMPVGKALDFIAVYPAGSTFAGGGNASETFSHDGTRYKFDYTIQADGKTTDLVAATFFSSTHTAVTLNMRHLLSQINFGVYAYKGAQITISDIEIVDVYEKGTFHFNTVSDGKGTWTAQSSAKTYTYDIYEGEGIAPWDSETDDKYIYGDGGKWAVDNVANEGTVWYWDKNKAGGADWNNKPAAATPRTQELITNSLMLMPQSFTGSTTAKIIFHYNIVDGEGNTITDGDGSFLLDDRDDWVEGFRYVYMIDFRSALDNQKLDDWTISLDTYPWVNYNEGSDDDGIVDVPMVAEPTIAELNALVNGDNVVLSGTLTSNTAWDWSGAAYTFAGLTANPNAFTLDFKTATVGGVETGVIFNGKTISITIPSGFSLSSTGATPADYVITGQTIVVKTQDAKVSITKNP